MTRDDAAPVVVAIAGAQQELLDFATAEAARWKRSLVIVHVTHEPPHAYDGFAGLDLAQEYLDTGTEVLEWGRTRVHGTAPRSHVTTRLLTGRPASVLARESYGAFEVIVGADEKEPWYVRVFDGEAAAALSRRAKCPVIVVPALWPKGRARTSVGRASVVALVDGDTHTGGVLDYAFRAAEVRGCSIEVLHVRTHLETEHEWRSRAEDIAAWFRKFPHVRGDACTINGSLRDEAHAATADASLLVIGRHEAIGRAFPSRAPLAQRVIEAAECPVAVIPSGRRKGA